MTLCITCFSLFIFSLCCFSDSDEEWQPKVSRGRKRSREGGDGEEEENAGPSQKRVAARARGRGSARGRGRGQGQGQASADAEEDARPWLDENTEDHLPTQPTFRPARTPGPLLIQGAVYTTLQLFRLFFTDTLLRTLLQNTNKFGSQHHGNKWSDISIPDIFSYLAVYMGMIPLPAITDYWRRDELYNIPFPKISDIWKEISTNRHSHTQFAQVKLFAHITIKLQICSIILWLPFFSWTKCKKMQFLYSDASVMPS